MYKSSMKPKGGEKCNTSKYQGNNIGAMRTGGKNAAISSMQEAGSAARAKK